MNEADTPSNETTLEIWLRRRDMSNWTLCELPKSRGDAEKFIHVTRARHADWELEIREVPYWKNGDVH